jgi:6-pyruvoyl-tetrahydropterin synthase
MKKTIYIILTLIVLFPVTTQGQNTKAAPSAKSGTEQNADTNKCGTIAEGGSTIEKLSRLEGAMSVRNLEFKYFDKFLFNLTDQDFNELKTLKPSCDGSAEEIAVMIFDKLKQKISEAKETRDNTIKWMEKTKKELQSLSVSPTTVKKIHNTWKEMESRSQEMLNDDLKYFAKFLNQIRRRVYEESAKQPSGPIKPFYPIKNLND